MSKLFTPLESGPLRLQHRIVMAPLTRYRADDNFVPLPIAKDYYSQRACVPGTLLVSEAVAVSERALGAFHVPGIWTAEQVAAWREITDAVHARGCQMACQLWHIGRTAQVAVLAARSQRLLSASAVAAPGEGMATPEAMTEADIATAVADFAAAARAAIEGAGFDAVEVHAANGYLPDQFLQDTCNQRTDGWGGSPQNRTRFALEVVAAVAAAVGPERTAIRLSPWSDFQGMGMADPRPTFGHLVAELRRRWPPPGPGLAYLHLVESRVGGVYESQVRDAEAAAEGARFFVGLWDNRSLVVLAGGFDAESAAAAVEGAYAGYDVAVAFGRRFVSNPDLVFRIREGLPLAPYDRSTFYTPCRPEGYVDYPFSKEFGERSDSKASVDK